jgi:hypothetical protein
MDLLFAAISRFKVGASGNPMPSRGDLAYLTADSHPVLLEWRDALKGPAELVATCPSAIYFARYESPDKDVITLSCYVSQTDYKDLETKNAVVFERMRLARRAIAVHLGLTIDVIEASVSFSEIMAADSYSALNHLFENLPNDRIHARSAPILVA